MTKNNLKCLFAVFMCLALFLLTGCFDLGDITSEDVYYDTFSSIKTISNDFSSDEYEMSDFYSNETIKDFDTDVVQKKYVYMFFTAERDVKINEIYMYFEGDNAKLNINLYMGSLKPSVETKKDENDNEYKEISFVSTPVARTMLNINSNSFNSMSILSFNGEKTYNVASGEYIIFEFENNKANSTLETSFKMTNLLIRAFFD